MERINTYPWLLSLLFLYAVLQFICLLTLPLSYEEGLNLLVQRFVSLDYQPYEQIFTTTWPLFTQLIRGLEPFSVISTRIVFLLFGLLLVVTTFLLARTLLDPLPSLATTFLLITSVTFLSEAGLIVEVIPALAVAMLAPLCVVRYTASERLVWAVVSGAVWGLALFLSIHAITVAVITLLLLLASGTQTANRYFALGLWLVGAGVVIVLGWSLAWTEIGFILDHQQLVYQNLGIDLADNFRVVGLFLGFNLWLTILAIYGAARLFDFADHRLWFAVIWGMASLIWLMLQVGLRLVDLAILLPPLALLAGWGLTEAGSRLSTQLRRYSPPQSNLVWTGLALLFFGVSWTRFNAYYLREVDTLDDLSQLQQQQTVAEFISRHTQADECVIVDDPALAVIADRLPLPQLVGLSEEWLESGQLTDRELATLITEGGCRAVVFSKREYHLTFAEDFGSWVISNFPNEEVYLRTRVYSQ